MQAAIPEKFFRKNPGGPPGFFCVLRSGKTTKKQTFFAGYI
ncbi:hypothetical protein HMPREF3293_02513 [Christensenella minuta]|jgi:hypothetical protein|uniref:Uncharacterized protein n=1 Tax=Christensenella minuta TaxID=626937 RepID=A0A136Q1I6_9FIRM|nr:hypothetical protein HMPREF3293_02513 [Christensenella minuta]